jgi:predicted ATPase
MTTIRTPDQRLRVFVSSTLEELSQERDAARRAIETLHLSPVLFELGARPHPPRQLYTAYLDQSEVFIGIYWQRYGWMAPEMEVSGLEDEFRLAATKPKLIYVKEPAPDREGRLEGLLDFIRSEGQLSYRNFATKDELKSLIEDDLSLLLSEHFRLTEPDETPTPLEDPPAAVFPRRVDAFVGRSREIDELSRYVSDPSIRLITVTGAGGVGKTRLALEVVDRCVDRFEDGGAFVGLGAITDPGVVVPTIIQTLAVQGSGADPLELLIEHLRERNLLLVLDNFEQVVFAAADVAHILEGCAGVTILVTSRAILHVRSELEYPLSPLQLPDDSAEFGPLGEAESVLLFVERARAVDPEFSLTSDNADAVAQICRRLDGLPLALELAAARIRMLSPASMLSRLESSLSLLRGGPRDAPERHQTLRSAIDWSYGLLNDEEKALFKRLGAFRGGWTLEAAEDVGNLGGDLDVLEVMTSLLEKSLIKQEELPGESRFSMLQTVWEYASAELASGDEFGRVLEAHALFYLSLMKASHQGLRAPSQVAWMARLEADNENLRIAFRWCLDHDRYVEAAESGWTIWLYWWINAHLQEGRDLMKEVLDSGAEIAELARAKALAVYGVMAFWQTDYAEALPALGAALEIMRAEGDVAGVALCQLPLGFVDAAYGNFEPAQERYLESIRFFEESGDQWGRAIALNAYGWASLGAEVDIGDEIFEESVEVAGRLGTNFEYGMALRNLGGYRHRRGEVEEARKILSKALRTLWHGAARGGSSYTIDAIGEIAADTGEPEIATRLFGATTAIRSAIGSAIIPMFKKRFDGYVTRLRVELGSERFAAEWGKGEELTMDETVRLALAFVEEHADDPAPSRT